MNPISSVMALLSRRTEIYRFVELYQKNKVENTEMIDLGRSLAEAMGLLESAHKKSKDDGNPVPVYLRKYDTKWIQSSLNEVMDIDLKVDGDLGGEMSETRAAVCAFQKLKGIKADGDPGIQTVAVLEGALQAKR
jgi:putative peptidoglycan binding protein